MTTGVSWCIVCGVSWALGAVVAWTLESLLLPAPAIDKYVVGVVSPATSAGALCCGLVTGALQGTVLRRACRLSPGGWIVRNGVAWTLESLVVGQYLFGLMLGLVQWRGLRKQGSWMVAWPLVAYVALQLGLRLSTVELAPLWEGQGGAVAVMGNAGIIGLLYGAGTAPFVALLRSRVASPHGMGLPKV